MKKGLLIGLTLILGGVLSGCKFSQIVDGDGMEREVKYPAAEQECIDNDGEVITDFEGNPICIFYVDEWCSLEDIEDGICEWLHPGGGERITVTTDMCNEQGGEVQQWNEGGDIQDICYFSDESFCYLEDLASGACEKGEFYYFDDTLYLYAEQACIDNNGQLSQTEDGEDICILSDEDFCYMSDVMDGACDLLYREMMDIYDMHEDERAYQEYIAECYNQPQITVCGKDGNSYYNKCFMDKAGIEEEKEVAEVIDGECVFG